MKLNMGSVDRSIRTVAGAVLVALGIIYQSWWGVLGAVLLITSAIGFCPLYYPFGINTRKEHHHQPQA